MSEKLQFDEACKELKVLKRRFRRNPELCALWNNGCDGYGFLVQASQVLVRKKRVDVARNLADICDGIGKDFWARLIRENVLGDAPPDQK